jgi:hypothetical protein
LWLEEVYAVLISDSETVAGSDTEDTLIGVTKDVGPEGVVLAKDGCEIINVSSLFC